MGVMENKEGKILKSAFIFIIIFLLASCGKSVDKSNSGGGENVQDTNAEQNTLAIKQATSAVSFSYSFVVPSFIVLAISIASQDNQCTTLKGSDKYFNECFLGGAKFSGEMIRKEESQLGYVYSLNLTFYFEVQQGKWEEFIRWSSEIIPTSNSHVINSARMVIGNKTWNFSKFSISQRASGQGRPPTLEISFGSGDFSMKDEVSRELKTFPSEALKISINFGEGGSFEVQGSGEISFEGWCAPEGKYDIESMKAKSNLKDVLYSILCPEDGEIKIGDKQIKFSNGNYEINGEKISCESASKNICSFI